MPNDHTFTTVNGGTRVNEAREADRESKNMLSKDIAKDPNYNGMVPDVVIQNLRNGLAPRPGMPSREDSDTSLTVNSKDDEKFQNAAMTSRPRGGGGPTR